MKYITTRNLSSSGSAAIATGESLSGVIDVRGFDNLGIQMPAGWTAADIAMHGSMSDTGPFSLVEDEAMAAIIIDGPSVDGFYQGLSFLSGIRYIKLASVSAADPTAAVNQLGDRTILFALES